MTDVQLIDLILLHEGSTYTNDPADAGGPTRWGVTIPVLAQFRRVAVFTIRPSDIEHLTRVEAAEVYQFLFILPFQRLPMSVLRWNVVDMGVNAGVITATRLLQMAIGSTVDGILGTRTLEFVTMRDWNTVYTGVRVGYYERLVQVKPLNMKWRNGWRSRALSFLSPTVLSSAKPRTAHERLSLPRYGATGKAYDIAA